LLELKLIKKRLDILTYQKEKVRYLNKMKLVCVWDYYINII